MMGSSCALQYTVPSARSRFVKPRVELAPRTVQIGFDLSPKGETLGDSTEEEEFDALPNSNSLMRVNGSQTAEERLNFTNSRNLSLIKPASGHAAMPHKRNAASTSPRSALQQLLLAPLTQSEPASTSPAADPSLTYGPLQLHPACNSSHATSSDAATRSSTGRSGLILHSTKPFTPVVHEPAVAAANHNWINSIAGQSRCASSIDDEMKRSQVPWTNKSERERIGKETRRMKELHELPACRGKNTQSGLIMKETTIGVERPYSHYHQKSSEVEIIGAKKESTNEKSKKSSLFVFVVSSPAAEYTTHNCLQYESDPYKSSNSMDMDFLNSCHLCKRPLNQGHDVFMYSGDKAFCSMECRYQQIVIDERNARHAPLVIRSGASPVFQNYTTTTTATAAATATTHRPIMINKTNFMNPTAAA